MSKTDAKASQSKTVSKKTGPREYIRQVRDEMKKVTWPTQKETMASTIAVFIMVIFAAIFLFLADQVMAFLVQTILNFS